MGDVDGDRAQGARAQRHHYVALACARLSTDVLPHYAWCILGQRGCGVVAASRTGSAGVFGPRLLHHCAYRRTEPTIRICTGHCQSTWTKAMATFLMFSTNDWTLLVYRNYWFLAGVAGRVNV